MERSERPTDWFFRGLWLRGEGRYDEALALYREVASKFPVV